MNETGINEPFLEAAFANDVAIFLRHGVKSYMLTLHFLARADSLTVLKMLNSLVRVKYRAFDRRDNS